MIYLLLGVNIVLALLVIALTVAKLLRPRRAPARVRVPVDIPALSDDNVS